LDSLISILDSISVTYSALFYFEDSNDCNILLRMRGYLKYPIMFTHVKNTMALKIIFLLI